MQAMPAQGRKGQGLTGHGAAGMERVGVGRRVPVLGSLALLAGRAGLLAGRAPRRPPAKALGQEPCARRNTLGVSGRSFAPRPAVSVPGPLVALRPLVVLIICT